MPDLSPELNLALAVDDDDTADYLDAPTNSLRASLLTLDGLFNAVTGHAHNGSHQGGALNFQNLTVNQDLNVIGASNLHGAVHAFGNVTIDQNLTVTGTSHFVGALTIDGAINSSGTLTIGQDLTVGRDLRVNRNAVVVGTLGVTGLSTFSGGLTTGGGGLTVGNTTITGTLSVSGSITTGGITSADWLRVSGSGMGVYNTLHNQGIGIGAAGPYNYANAASLVNMAQVSVAATPSLLVQRDGNGYVEASYINYSGGGAVAAGKPSHVLGRNSPGDSYMRWWPTSAIGPPISAWYVQANLTNPALSSSGGSQDATFAAVANTGGFGVSGTLITVPRPGYYSIAGGFNGNNLTGNSETMQVRLYASSAGQLDQVGVPLKITSYFGGFFSWAGFLNQGETIRLNYQTSFDSINGGGEILVAFIPTADYNQ